MAYELVNQVNTLHRGGFDQLGNTNQNFFTPLAGVDGAARLIEVDPAVEADSRLIAAAGVNEVGDNTVAKSLANLRDALVLEGNSATLVDSWSHLAFRVGRDTRAAVDGLEGAERHRRADRRAARRRVGRVARRGGGADDQVPARLRGQRALLQHRGPDVVDPVLDRRAVGERTHATDVCGHDARHLRRHRHAPPSA